ncbi:hypothetical protein ACO0OL_002349 [Hanseniaspora opuntiae]|uniref:ATPase inhibitor, mitochondrial n=1 Tax=Hanseniaspora opuntiae TaxID=211096 RepID=A0A1E5RST7_9ASCO|nr:hypothetical protein AWRI3578_g967 [Hanseniaspora opuntiae]
MLANTSRRITSTLTRNCPSCSNSALLGRASQRLYSLDSINQKEKAEESLYVQKKEKEVLEQMKATLEQLKKEVEEIKKSKKD